MNSVPLTLGPLNAASYTVRRSGIRWLVEDGHFCSAHQPIGWFNISLEPDGLGNAAEPLFADERELHVVVAPRVSGRLRIDADMARGGYLSVHSVTTWDGDTRIGEIETEAPGGTEERGDLRLMMLAGRRMTELADVFGAPLAGWHSRARGWWCDEGETPLTLVSLGVCDTAGILLGAESAFLETFQASRRAMQVVHVPDHPIAPCLPILLDQLDRTPAQFATISADVNRHFGSLGKPLTPQDWLFIGTMLTEMKATPIKDSYDIITPEGARHLRSPDALLLSLVVEPQTILRHRKLGYHMHVMRHHQAAAGPAVREWLSSAFEPVKRPLEAIRADYESLIDKLRRRGTRLIVLNRMSTSGHEDISSYMGFDAPLSNTLSYVAAKEWNLMLHDIAATRDFDVIDVDAVAAEIGGSRHLPDGVHQSGALQAILREQVLGCMDDLAAARQPARP